MNRLSIALVALVGILAGGLGVSLLRPQAPGLAEPDARAIIAQQLSRDQSPKVAAVDPGAVNKLIEDYLMSDPTILQRMNDKLDAQKADVEHAAEKASIDAHYADIYQSPDGVVLGNPKGDVTLVEMFDYNCVYCRRALPDMAQLLTDDPNLKIILKQFPILSQGSVDAARIAYLVSQDPKINYWDFHQKLFSLRAGEVGADQALQVAEEVGGNRGELMLDMNANRVSALLQKNYDLAKALGIGGTPSYILGDTMIPGAVPIDDLKLEIANLRACGSTACPSAAGTTSPAG
jgi:protein-disulfide isomerase